MGALDIHIHISIPTGVGKNSFATKIGARPCMDFDGEEVFEIKTRQFIIELRLYESVNQLSGNIRTSLLNGETSALRMLTIADEVKRENGVLELSCGMEVIKITDWEKKYRKQILKFVLNTFEEFREKIPLRMACRSSETYGILESNGYIQLSELTGQEYTDIFGYGNENSGGS